MIDTETVNMGLSPFEFEVISSCILEWVGLKPSWARHHNTQCQCSESWLCTTLNSPLAGSAGVALGSFSLASR